MKVGERVGAILGHSNNVLSFLGYGVYVGDEVPITAAGQVAEIMVEEGISNPKIRLDNGKIVWGCECWWGGEASVKKQVEKAANAGVEVIEVDIDKVRKDFAIGE